MDQYVVKTSPVEAKVKASTGGATAGVVVGALVIWGLQNYVFKGSDVPVPIQAFVYLVVPAALTAGSAFVSGYLAKHTPR